MHFNFNLMSMLRLIGYDKNDLDIKHCLDHLCIEEMYVESEDDKSRHCDHKKCPNLDFRSFDALLQY